MSSTAHTCFKCNGSASPQQGSDKAERLTCCRGSTFLKRFLEEGFVTDELGHEQPASFSRDSRERNEATACDSSGGAQRYFYQNCLGRRQATALSYDTNVLSFCKKQRCYQKRNICHLACDDCLAQLRDSLGANGPSLQIKLQNATGMSLLAASSASSSARQAKHLLRTVGNASGKGSFIVNWGPSGCWKMWLEFQMKPSDAPSCIWRVSGACQS